MTTPDQYRREGAEALREAAAEACADYPRVAPDESEWTHYDEQIAHSQACIRAIDPAEVLAKVGADALTVTPQPDADAVAPLPPDFASAIFDDVEALYETDGVLPKPATDAVARLMKAARERDGGAHDPDCRINRRSNPFCDCGHDDLMSALAAMEADHD